MKLDSRKFSKEAYDGLTALIKELTPLANSWIEKWADKQDPKPSQEKMKEEERKKLESYRKKSSGLVQGLPAYISTWGLHRLSGDAKKFLNGTAEDTKYKGKVYREFLVQLKKFSHVDFDPDSEGSLINLPSLHEYTALNHLAIQLAKEWAFWSASILGEPEEG